MRRAAFLVLCTALWGQKDRVLLPPPTTTGQQPGAPDTKPDLDWRIKPEHKPAPKKITYEYKVVSEKLELASSDLTLGLKYPLPPPLVLPERRTFKLDNGLMVHLLENRELPRWEAVLLARGGTLHDPPEKTGLAAVSVSALREGGTKAKPGDAFAKAAEAAGVSLSVEGASRHCLIRARAASEAGPAAVEALRDLAVSPEYDLTAVDATLGRFRAAVANRNRDVAGAVNRELNRAIYGASIPQGRLIEFDNLENIDRGDIVNFHRRTFAPGNSVLILEGDFSAADAEKRVTALFSAWTGKPVQKAALETGSIAPSPAIRYIESREIRRGVFAVGHLGGSVKDPDYPALLLLAEILGGNGASRLRKLGLSNPRWEASFSSGWQAEADAGIFRVSGSVAPWATTDAVAAVLAEIGKLASQPPTQREFEEAQNRLLGLAASRYSRPLPSLIEMSLTEAFGLPASHIASVYQQIAKLDRASLAAIARKRMRPADCSIVVAGSETVFDRPLATLSRTVTPLDLTPPPPKPVEPRVDAQSIAAGKAWIEKMRTALGGGERLSQIRQWAARWEGKIWFGASPVDARRYDRWIAEEVYRQEVESDAGRTIVFYNGSIGWLSDRRGIAPLSIPIQKQVRGELFRLLFRLAASDRDPARTVSHLGSNIVAVSNAGGDAVRIYFDEETALPQRLTYWTMDAAAAPVSVEETLLDWREVDGVKLPGRVIVKQNGSRFEDARLTEAKFSGLSIAEMEKKP